MLWDTFVRFSRDALNGDQARIEQALRAEAARLHKSRRSGSARVLERMLASRPQTLQPLNMPGSDLLHWEEPQRPLASITLEEGRRAEVFGLLRELRHREALEEFGLAPRRSLLLAGPTGNGKTSLARSLASELGLPLASVRMSQMVDSYMGKSEASMQKVFDSAARQCVLFFDELDALGSRRGATDSSADKAENRIVIAFLMGLDRLSPATFVVAATNRPKVIDPAVRRRFDCEWTLPAPNEEQLRGFAEWIAAAQPEIPIDVGTLTLGKSFATAERAVLTAQRQAILSRLSA